MQITLRKIQDADVAGRRVLVRADLNLPVASDGVVGDCFRLTRALKTIRHLTEQGAKVIVISHFGRKGESLQPVADVLAEEMGKTFRFSTVSFADAAAETKKMTGGEVLLLENLRREAGEEGNDPAFAEMLAVLGDIYVGDAFAAAHREHASITAVPKLLPAYAGFVMQEEVEKLSEALEPPEGSVAFIGGAKFETKLPLIKKFLKLYAKIYIVGAIANDFMKARGLEIGTSLVSDFDIPRELIENNNIFVQSDVLVTNGAEERETPSESIHIDECIVDAGPESARQWGEEILRSPFVVWNGPLGIYEKGFTKATDVLAEALAKSKTKAVLGGGDTIAAVSKISFDESRVFLSTGGGAMLQFLADGTLPGIDVLRA